MFGIDFYPTPEELLDKITENIDWKMVKSVLEPSAGKGDIADFVKKKAKKSYYDEIDIDCIELDKNLQNILKGKGYHVIHNDFLTFNTYKNYDLIIMNPPFSNGAAHLIKALDIQKNGGSIICILNAETIKNPYTNERKILVNQLNNYNANIVYMKNGFSNAEHKTNVEIAVIKVTLPEKEKVSVIFEKLKKKHYEELKKSESTDLIVNDYIKAAVYQYNLELDAGIHLIREYYAMQPYIMNDLDDNKSYRDCILQMRIGDKNELSINKFVEKVRMKYWNALFSNPKFTKHMTSNLVSQYQENVSRLKHYDFSEYNINEIRLEMSQNLVKGIEECIIELFDELSHRHAWYTECEHNIHYYNGWKTNKAWIINKKVIIPLNAFDNYFKEFRPTNYYTIRKLADIEKALNYLDGGLTVNRDMCIWLKNAEQIGQTKKIHLKYFDVTFYKKGTCHIEFTNLELLKKLNIFGSQRKGWLPPGYGKVKYSEMDQEAKAVINEFEGEEEYSKTVHNSSYYLFDANDIPLLESK